MKHQLSSSSSSMKSTTITMEDDVRTETRDSNYFPGCRKDANCKCEICLASINATLDLMPLSVQKSSFSKLSASKPKYANHSPISFDPSITSTPTSSSCCLVESPALKSTARLNFRENKEKKKKKEEGKNGGFQSVFWKLLMGLNLVLVMEVGFSWGVGGFLKPILTSDVARSIGERASIMQDLNGKLRFLQNELKGFHNLKVSNCSNTDSVWEIDQGSLLLNSHCLLYKSAMEEVKIWGWPLQTAGLLTTGFSSKSFTILSGRVSEVNANLFTLVFFLINIKRTLRINLIVIAAACFGFASAYVIINFLLPSFLSFFPFFFLFLLQWSNGRSGFIITRKANASWVQSKWGTSVIQMDPNTWIFEYQRSWILDNPRLISATLLELLKDRLTKMVKKMSEEFLLFFVFDNQCIEFSRNEDQLMIPT
ncbi:uncharacterized protein [Gossypium hirsutum]|uniref:Uncharacterized protein isoform X1 n=1 Tax=Gossypium hirsutum TaxID=3635 RepID=A0ABM2YZT1_GOSHI|nr:uncharacterized protein LOC107927615 isoform X1 [Gossypium hirsutum]